MMFDIKKHAQFFKSILKARDKDIEVIISNANLRQLYATIQVIREVLNGKIPIAKQELEKLKQYKKLFKLARLTW